MRHRTREAWLQAVVSALRPKFRQAGYALPRKVAVSCGWPSSGGTGVARTAWGQCWIRAASPEGINQIFVTPVLADELKVADCLVHELLHAALDSTQHDVHYRRGMKALGLMGPPSDAHAGRALRAELAELIRPLGPYPHFGLKP